MTKETVEFQIKSLVKDQPEKAFDLLYQHYYTLVARTAYYITKSTSTAEDLAQEVFMSLWVNPVQIQAIKNLKGYLLISVKNSALNVIEKDKNRVNRESAYVSLSVQDEATEDIINAKPIIEKMINALAPKTRLVFTMSRFEGLTNDEISEYLGISKRTVETQISLAIRSLKEKAKDNAALLVGIILLSIMMVEFLTK